MIVCAAGVMAVADDDVDVAVDTINKDDGSVDDDDDEDDNGDNDIVLIFDAALLFSGELLFDL